MTRSVAITGAFRRSVVGQIRRFLVLLRTMTRLQWLASTLLWLVLAAMWMTVVTLLEQQRAHTLEAEMLHTANVSKVLQEQTVRVIAATDQAVVRLAQLAGEENPGSLGFQHIAESTGLSGDILVQLALIDKTGHFVGSNLDPTAEKTGRIDLSEREHIQVHLIPAAAKHAKRILLTPEGLFIGKPVQGKVSDKWTIQLSRAVKSQSGRVVGVVVASVNPAYFEKLYSQVALGQKGGLTLLGGDGVVRARVIGGKSVGLGTSLGANSRSMRDGLQESGSWTGPSGLDGEERLTAYQKAGVYPLYVFAVTSVHEALAAWRSTRNLVVGLAVLLSVVLSGAGILVLSGVRRLESQHRALQASEAEARVASQAKTEFLAAISHELRTPLTSIRGFAELMERRGSDGRFREQAMLIRKASEHLNALLSEILDLSTVEAGNMKFVNEDHDIRQLIEGTVEPHRDAAESKGLTLSMEWGRVMPIEINTDARRLAQVLGNLVSNAVKFTQQGGVVISASTVKDVWVFEVSDTGPGIPEQLHETIFEKFRQGDSRVSYEHGGTGLGLALSRALVHRMGGDVTLNSEMGVGSTFIVTLPRSRPICPTSKAEIPVAA